VVFEIVKGLKETAAKVADFLSRKDKALVRKWDAFARTKTMAAAQKQLALAKSKSIEAQVAAIPLSKKGGKKSPDDAFVVGTADLRLSDKHADVRFRVIKTVKAVADFLFDYVLAAPVDVKREWHIFYRSHSEEDANKYVAQLRKWYDDLEKQRDAIAAIYSAASTSRC
jgi:hypothetical protein